MPHLSKSTVAGALIGCAVGDAMGAPFEGLWSESIPTSESLLAGFHEYHGYALGQFTDDTQLTLATIESIVAKREIVVHDIGRRIAELWRHQSVIGPGGACTQAAERFLVSGDHRNMGAPDGQAGNGTAMRTAALGLWYGDDHDSLISEVAEISRLTHQDPRSIAGGVAVAMAGNLLAYSRDGLTPVRFCGTLADSCRSINAELADFLAQLPNRIGAKSALEFIAYSGQDSPEFDRPIISPFVIPTVLAAVYSMLIQPDSWTEAVTTAIRLGGDVDTLGAIVGALAGIRDGFQAIPTHLAETVHNSGYIQELSAQYHSAICDQCEIDG